MELSSVTTSQTASKTAAQDGNKAVISSDFETFLKMLSTQLQNQDPLNPVESADYAVQLATFSSVEQQVLTNNHLQDLAERIQVSGMSDLAGWVGMEAQSLSASYYDGEPVTVLPDPPSAADRAVLVVKNASGNVVYRDDLPLTNTPYQWSGDMITGAKAPTGTYSFEVESSANGETLSTDPVSTYGRVIEARRTDTDTILVLEGGNTVSASEVTGLRAAQ
ncbi:flagellar hook capping FlgD N-terminal domain-containing protein [Pseudooceanicola sp. MF1-13]|uniref:flagellar hook capping FlgD N-terminal domain-containing protein n=1 Tax=Pseudooceanicola sp. MF1-13 TaxID=3379095 RepID=UPI003892811F